MGDVANKFIRPMMAVLPAPRTDDLAAYVDVYVNILSDFNDDVLERAANYLLRTIRIKSMPVPADCFDACQKSMLAAIAEETSENPARRPDDIMAEREHLQRLNKIAADGDIERATNLFMILLRSNQTKAWTWNDLDISIKEKARKHLAGKNLNIPHV